jgi:prepilin peptidase CpaA
MDPSSITSLLCLVGFAGLSLASAVTDIQKRRIPNSFTLVIALLWGVHLLANFGQVDWIGGLSVGGALLVLGFILFATNLLGAGDVKMLAAAGLWAGFAYAPYLLAVTGIVGGLLGVGYLLGEKLKELPWLPLPLPDKVEPDEDGKRKIYLPYGVAICAGALVVAVLQAQNLALTAP